MRARPGSELESGGWGAWLLRFGGAFLLLNALLTFENLWPTAWVKPGIRLSFELCLLTLALMLWVAWRGRVPRRGLALLAALYTALVLVRYVDVTVPALFGRPVNLYWDGRHSWEVLRLAASSAPAWQTAAAGLAALGTVALVYTLARTAIGMLAQCLAWHRPRPWLLAAGSALGVSFAVHPYAGHDTRWFFSLPVWPTIAHQASIMPALLSRPRTEARLTPSPPFAQADVSALRGADVLVLFAESYGATTLDRPDQRDALAPARQALQAAVDASGRQVVSMRVHSPTFGGASWLAHAALLAGVDTRDPDDHELLLTTQRPTLASFFSAHGYRTVAWMPGVQRPWPEGRFYRFDRYGDAASIGYAGPEFGYWRIPDQASMALLHQQELGPRRADPSRPRFVVFPTVNTHAPFRPLPPLLDGALAALAPGAYPPAQQAAALAAPVSWLDPVPAYLESLRYTHGWLAQYLVQAAPPSLVLLVIGDHQPLASVSGRAASWDVPVHLIAHDPALLARFAAIGFEPGLLPGPAPARLDMHELTEAMLAAFGGAGPAARGYSLAPPVPTTSQTPAAK